MDEAIIRAVKQEHGLLIGRNAARNLKMTLGMADGSITEAETVGVDAARRIPRVERISAKLVAAAIEPTVAAITGEVQEMLSDIPPNLAEEVVRGKIRIAGGALCCLALPTGSRQPPISRSWWSMIRCAASSVARPAFSSSAGCPFAALARDRG